MAAFTALTLLTAQASFAQTWAGGTSVEFTEPLNWSTAPDFSLSNTYSIGAVVAPNNNPVLNTPLSAASFGILNMGIGSNFTINASLTTNHSTNSSVDGTLNVNAGTFKLQKLYIGVASGASAVVNVATGGILNGTGVWRIGSQNNSGTHNLFIKDGGKFIMDLGSSLTIGTTSSRRGVLTVNTGGLAQISGGLTISTTGSTTVSNGTINVDGGSLEYNPVDLNIGAGKINISAGSFKLLNTTGTTTITNSSTTADVAVIKITGGSLDVAGPLAIGNSTVAGLVTVNLTGGTMNIAGNLTISEFAGAKTAVFNIDAGSIVLAGDQKSAIDALVTAGAIKATTLRTISVAYDGTKTTIVANVTPLGVNDVALDANAIVVYAQNQNINIQSGNAALSEVKVYDLNGRLVASKSSIESKETSIPLNNSNGVYVVKVTTTDGAVVTKKIIQ
ncbi:T9SS sorting signal type C domain-containing protein [Flavobacterium fluvii]|nr:T9SS sorting signal type C domain-containing protein [Flavobacterium fluvii]